MCGINLSMKEVMENWLKCSCSGILSFQLDGIFLHLSLFFVSPAKQKRDICIAFPASLSAAAAAA